jgi:tRNA A-37 threonylcarbamoyl transferase component Bud32
LDLPFSLGRYELLEVVGKGAMGSVYRARHKALENIVAVKLLHPKCSANEKLLERFISEAKAAGRLSHPNVVRGIDAGKVDGRYFLVMEFVDGPPLDRMISESGRLPEERALRITLDVAKALGHARENHVVHRDVKPGNILVGKDGRAKLTDLGLATRLDIDEKKPGTAMGTPAYISPEQIQARSDVDIRSDIYSLGMTFYHMLTGHPPYSGDPTEVMAKHLTETLPDPRGEVPELSKEAVLLLRRMTEKRREDRFQDPDDLAGDIQRILAGESIATRESGRSLAGRHLRRSTGFNVGVAAVGAGVIALGALVAWALTGGGGPPPEDPGKTPVKRPGGGETKTGGTGVSEIERESQRAEEALEKARRFRAEHPGEYAEAIRMFQAVIARGDTGWGKFAREDIEKIRAEREREAEAALGEALREARKAEEKERFGQGRKALQDFLSNRKAAFGETKAFVDAQVELKDLVGRAAALVARLEEEARKCLEAGQFPSARACADRIREIDPDTFGSSAETLLREAGERERRKEELAREREGLARLEEARRTAEAAVRAWKIMDAVGAFEAVRAESKSPSVWRLASLETGDLDRLSDFLKALGSAKAAVGKELTIDGKAGKITDVAGGYVHVVLGPARTAFRLQDLKPEELGRLAEIGLLPADAKWARGLAVYFLYQGMTDKARALIGSLELTDEEKEFYKAKTGG